MLDIYEMQIFLTAAETGSFSEAGRRLQMSQPAVSMQIRSLGPIPGIVAQAGCSEAFGPRNH